jgi:diguanylate cyclase (GGDEF)-like protein
MNRRSIRNAVLVLLLASVPAAWSADSSFESMLRQADELRTSNAEKFRSILSDLDSLSETATPEQRQQLRLLHAYRAVLSGDSETAIGDLKELVSEGQSVRVRFRAGAMLANTYAITRQFEEGLKVLDAILPLSKSVTDPESRHHGLLAAGILYNQVGEFELGRHYAEQVMQDSPSGRSQCIAGILRFESLQGTDKAPEEAAIRPVIDECETLHEPILVGFAWTYLARKLYADGSVDAAIDVLERYLPEVEDTGYPRLIAEYHALLAEYRMTRGDVEAAKRHAEDAIAQSAALGSAQSLVVGYRTLYEIAERRGDLAEALLRYRQYAEADKAYFNDVKSREMAYQVVRHQSLQQAQQIALLNQQNQLLQLQQRVQEQSAQNSRLVMAMLLLLMAFMGLWAYRTKRMQTSLRRMAETDALTEVCNRHHFNRQSEAALAQCARSGEEVALVMFDLDHFKAINDRYGHGVGDWVLRKVVETCRPICRQVDFLGRIGGEEFAVLMCGYDLRAAKRMADDCRVRLAGIDTGESGYVFRITASFGVTTSHMSGYDLTRLLSHADKALYRAKRGGRNRVCVYEGNVPSQPVLVHAAEEPAAAGDDVPAAGAAIDLAAARKRSTATS